jgi:hypothetical protein
MFIKLTNANPNFLGKPILLKKDLIVSVYEGVLTHEDASVESVTYVFAPPHGEWQVKESVDDVLESLRISTTKI